MGESFETARLIALDWGTTNVRAALLDTGGSVLDERRGESGVGQLDQHGFETRFDELTQDWPYVPAIAAGMVGSRQGWREAHYLACPTGIDGLADNLTRFEYDGRSMAIVSGLKMDTPTHHDVMRGEETQIAGFLASNADFDGTLVLPGTHSKWVHVKRGVVERFCTYMTGDLFSALAEHTMLRPSVFAQDPSVCASSAVFQQAVADVFTAGGSAHRHLFDLRARTLLTALDTADARERLSGLLIGMELHAASQDGFDVQDQVLIGSSDLLERYQSAGSVLGADMVCHEGTGLIWPALYNLAKQASLC